MSKKTAILVMIATLVLFQNCAKTSFTSVDGFLKLTNSSSETEGNGTGYGGKLVGEFYRFTPDFTCEGKESAVSLLSLTESDVTLTENKRLFCGAKKTVLATDLIDRSVYQNDIIGYQEGIFQSEKAAPTSIPSNLVEVWCRDSSDRSAIETITHYDRSTQLAVTRIHLAGEGTTVRTIPDFNVSRLLSPMLITISEGENFSLKIYRDRPATQLGLFQARLEVLVDGQKIARDTSCRLGGSLDVSQWPAQQIVDLNMTAFQFSPDLQSFGFKAQAGLAPASLFSSPIQGGSQYQVTNSDPVSFAFTPDSKSLVYWAEQRLPGKPELFKAPLDGSSSAQLSSPAAPPNLTSHDLKFSADGSQVIYQDGSVSFVDNETSLHSVSLMGGSVLTLSPPSTGADDSVHDFAVSTSLSKVALLSGVGLSLKLHISNLDGSGLYQPTIPYPSSGWTMPYGTRVHAPSPGKYAFVQAMRTNGPLQFMTSAIAFDGSKVVSFPIDWNWVKSNSDGNIVLLSSNQNPPAYKLMNLTTSRQLDLPGLQPQNFSKDGSTLIGSETATGGQSQAVAIDVNDGTKTVLCPQVSAKTSQLLELETGRWLMSAWDATSGAMKIYVHANGQCQLRNSLPLPKPTIKGSYVTKDLGSLVLHANVTDQNVPQDHLYFVPLNGRPSLQIDSPVYLGALIEKVLILPDSKTVFYTGPQIKAGESGAFLWKAP